MCSVMILFLKFIKDDLRLLQKLYVVLQRYVELLASPERALLFS
jgi:hypothetical protein